MIKMVFKKANFIIFKVIVASAVIRQPLIKGCLNNLHPLNIPLEGNSLELFNALKLYPIEILDFIILFIF
jgi:hypothetical protein